MQKIKTTFVLFFLLLNAYQLPAQKKTVASGVLEIILKENDFHYKRMDNVHPVYEQDSAGNLTAKIYKENIKPKKTGAVYKVALIDTFGFFTPQCNGLYGSYSIEVHNKPILNPQKQELENIFWVSSIEAGKENAFCIVFEQQVFKQVYVYCLSISGRIMKIVKKKMFDL